MNTYMPFDIVNNILCRVPVPSLVRLKLVCKQWYTRINDPDFIDKHLDCAKKHSSGHHISYLLRADNGSSICLYSVDEVVVAKKKLPKVDDHIEFMLPSCNGLICLYNCGHVRFCNPATQQIITLPNNGKPEGDLPCCGFGFDPSIKQRKVVQLWQNSSNSYGCEIFTLGTKSWRVVGNIRHRLAAWRRYALVNGSIYWMIDWMVDDNFRVQGAEFFVLFDMEDEKYSAIRPPECYLNQERRVDELERLYLVDLEGSLGLVDMIRRIDIWILKDSKNHVWVKNYCIELHLDPYGYRISGFPIDVTFHDGNILIIMPREMLSYDPQRKCFNKIYRFEETECWFNTSVHLGSLLPLEKTKSPLAKNILE